MFVMDDFSVNVIELKKQITRIMGISLGLN